MFGLGQLVFATPWVLAALAALPVIYWLLRVTPPSPRAVRFPAIRLLRDLVAREETPDRTPWWLLLLRLVIAGLIIVALARPLLNPEGAMPGSGPVLLVVDNGWASARDWPARQRLMADVIDRADRAGRPVVLLATAPPADGSPVRPSGLMAAAEARGAAEALQPLPWPTDRAAALAALDGLALEGSVHSLWLTDGLGDAAAEDLALRLQRLGSAEAVSPTPEGTARLLAPPEADRDTLTFTVARVASPTPPPVWLRALAADGRLLAREPVSFAEGAATGTARLVLPAELRNELARAEIEGEATAGAVVLLDERWRRRPVGLVSDPAQSEPQPLLSETYYVARALEPFAELRRGTAASLLDGAIAVLVLADDAVLSSDERARIDEWMTAGGMVVRFAGPLLASEPDELVPVPLRAGDRTLDGTLSWTEPMPLAPFDATSPFAGLAVPDDVRIQRQVLAEPSLDLDERTWARLADGTPLVTSERRGEGWLVLVHTSAAATWSNLPLSGLFVDMLRRLVELSEGVAGTGGGAPLEPWRTLDGFGRLGTPPPTALPIAGERLADVVVGPSAPPGFYGTESARWALNLGAGVTDLAALPPLPEGVATGGYAARGELDLLPWLLAAALTLALVDQLIALALRGALGRPRRRVAAAVALLLLAGLLLPQAAGAQTDDEALAQVANNLYLAYVETGDTHVDAVSRAGLQALAQVLHARTAVEAAGAVGVDVASDELAFFPLLYWPVVPEQATALTPAAVDRLNAYLHGGGMIVFDTRGQGAFSGSLEALRTITQGLDIPPLTPVPPDHVLTKSFYLLRDFPGRSTGGEVWVEEAGSGDGDGVSGVVIGGNDWAGAWATDDSGQPLFAVVPGGERQREMAYRYGVNLVMYALTGNYKADQVHVPAILERLGQ